MQSNYPKLDLDGTLIQYNPPKLCVTLCILYSLDLRDKNYTLSRKKSIIPDVISKCRSSVSDEGDLHP